MLIYSIWLCRDVPNLFNRASSLDFQLLKMSWGKSGNFLELMGQMGHAAIIHLPGNLRDVEFIVNNQLFDPFNLM